MYKAIYESPTTEKVQVEVEGNVCTSLVFKKDIGSNAEVDIKEQGKGNDGTEFEYDTFTE